MTAPTDRLIEGGRFVAVEDGTLPRGRYVDRKCDACGHEYEEWEKYAVPAWRVYTAQQAREMGMEIPDTRTREEERDG